jgi:putative PIN family toxin of toxin-antitoxin system
MSLAARAVIDTNVLVSGSLYPLSVPRQAVEHVLAKGVVLTSRPLLAEFHDVLARPKFDKRMARADRLKLFEKLIEAAVVIDPTTVVTDCRDPKDNMVLELAIDGRATCIITGDADLLALHPFRGVPVLSPADFLAATAPPAV